MATISEDIQKSDAGDLVELFQLSLHSLGIFETFFFTSSSDSANAQFVSFQGHDYIPIDIDASGFEWNSAVAFPTPTLRVSNVFSAFSVFNIDYNDLLGAEVVRMVTLAKFTDAPTGFETNEVLSYDRFKIDRKVNQNKIFVEYELVSHLDHENVQLPKRTFNRDFCDHTYRRWDSIRQAFNYEGVTCPYADEENFDVNGTGGKTNSEDTCSKRVSTGCDPRFGSGGVTGTSFIANALPFHGYPAVSKRPR